MGIEGITPGRSQVVGDLPDPSEAAPGDGLVLPAMPALEEGGPAFVMFTTPTCPWCSRAKEFLQALHKERGDFQVAVIDANEQPEAFRAVQARTRATTVPQIFLDGHFVGGWRELAAAAKRGQLDAYLDGGDWQALAPEKKARRGLFRRS